MTEVSNDNVVAKGWRLKLGVALFALSIVFPVLGVPLVASMGLPSTTVATVSGVLLVVAEVLGVVAVAVMGKSGYAYIKNHIFGFLKQYGPPAEVSRTRYTIGLVMFSVPVVFGWLTPYAADLIPGYLGNEFTYAIVGDLLLLVSLFVLGGDFWDKLRALFISGAKAVFPKMTA
ncbi:MAG: transporter suffix domain-containing protein [Sulfurovum sp.]|nr:transporter suffix domain-containing protein [Sulfurovum sp.]